MGDTKVPVYLQTKTVENVQHAPSRSDISTNETFNKGLGYAHYIVGKYYLSPFSVSIKANGKTFNGTAARESAIALWVNHIKPRQVTQEEPRNDSHRRTAATDRAASAAKPSLRPSSSSSSFGNSRSNSANPPDDEANSRKRKREPSPPSRSGYSSSQHVAPTRSGGRPSTYTTSCPICDETQRAATGNKYVICANRNCEHVWDALERNPYSSRDHH